MPWLSSVKAVLHTWYLGNECGNAIAKILYRIVNPSGRLPLTFPKREQDVASYSNFKSARTKVYYSESIWVGYKWHNMRHIEPLFPFGCGLSYTEFQYSGLEAQATPGCMSAERFELKIKVNVTNIGLVSGSHAVHFYLSPPSETSQSLVHPQWSMQGFTKLRDLAPSETRLAAVTLDKCTSIRYVLLLMIRCCLALG